MEAGEHPEGLHGALHCFRKWQIELFDSHRHAVLVFLLHFA